jgi:hypothetical protein
MGNVNAIRGVFRPVSLGLWLAWLAAAVAGCASPPPPFPELPRLDVSTRLGSRHLCGMGISPPIRIDSVPSETALYRLRLTNTDVLFQQPWQTTVPASSRQGIAEGAIADFVAPCVGELRLNSFYPYRRYRLEVMALDSQSRPLAYGQTTFLVRSVNSTLERERATGPRTPEPALDEPELIGPDALPQEYETLGPQMSPLMVPEIQSPVLQP